MVIDRGAFLSGRYAKVYDEIVRVKEACGDAHLKVILETGELGTYDNVRRASLLAMAAGADFIKTSTGKISPAATLPVALVMLEAIRDVHDETGRVVGFKPAGGIRTVEAGDPAPRAGARDARPRLADARPLPLRRLVAPQRRADADPQGEDGPRTRARTTSPLTDLERKQERTPVPSEWTYAPAPESRDVVQLRERYGHFVGGEWLEPSETYTTICPATGGAARRGRRRRRPRTSTSRSRPRASAFENGWSALPGSERAKYLFRIARILQERAREFAVLESLNGGKPIKESRDVDLPLAAAHFFYYAGWADKLEYAFPNRQAEAGRRRGPDHPVELPAADARVEDRAGARVREHRRAQARGDDAADRAALLRRRCARRSCRRASSTSSPATAAPAPRSSSTRASTRSRSPARPRSARRSSASSPAPARS